MLDQWRKFIHVFKEEMIINGHTRIFGIIGNPVKHSLSPVMHNRAFNELGINAVYLPFCVANVEDAVKGIRALGIQGTSVTIPHKQSVMEFIDEIDPVAKKIGAVNTLALIPGDTLKIYGCNTDWIGANRALLSKTALQGKTALILGAGGSARAIGFGLQEEGVSIRLCSRTEKKGRELADELGCQWLPLNAVDETGADILINATSVGMAPKDNISLVSQEGLKNYPTVMDIVYAPLETLLLKNAREAGCATVNGLEMLLYQGVAQFELWTDAQAPVEIMRQALMEATGNL